MSHDRPPVTPRPGPKRSLPEKVAKEPASPSPEMGFQLLKEAVERHGSRRVAAEIDYSTTTISRMLAGKYEGDVASVLDAVILNYGAETHQCPLQGEISRKKCSITQARPFAATNPARVRQYRACRACEKGS